MRSGFERHPLSELFGDMNEKALLAMAEDVKARGISEPVVLYEGKVLDGWQRCKAGQIAEIDIPTIDFDGEDPSAFVVSKNLHRRHHPLSASQRAMIVVAAEAMRPHGRPQNENVKTPKASQTVTIKKDAALRSEKSVKELAEQAETSERTITDAKAAKEGGLEEEVRKGEISVEKAAEKVRERKKPGKKKDKKPSPTEKLKAENADLKAIIRDLEESITDLTDEINLRTWADLDKSKQVLEMEKLQRHIRTLESQRNDYQNECNQWKRAAKRLQKKLG